MEGNLSAGRISLADLFQILFSLTMLEEHRMGFAIAMNSQFKPVRKRIDHGNTHPVQTTRDFITILVKFTPSVKLSHDYLSG